MPPISRDDFRAHLQEMDPSTFEDFIADVWAARGWTTRVTPDAGDRGIDVIAERHDAIDEKHLIQAKRYADDNPVGSPEIQQYASLRQQEPNVDAIVIATSSRFTDQAETVAHDLNVKLVDADDLYDIITNGELDGIVAEYFSTGTTTRSEEVQKPSGTSTDPTTTPDESTISWTALSIAGVVALISGMIVAGAAIAPGILSDAPRYTTTPGTPTEQSPTSTPRNVFAVGESTTHAGLRFSVLEYRTANRLGDATPNEYAQDVLPVTAPSGAQFLLVKVRVTNVGEQEYTPPDSWMLSYKDDGVIPEYLGNFTVNETRYVVYSEVRNQQQDPGIYPGGSVTGWIVFEVPDEFDSSAAVVTVDYETRDGDTWTARWELELR